MHSDQYILVIKALPLFGKLLANYFYSSEYQTTYKLYSEAVISSTGIRHSIISEILQTEFNETAIGNTLDSTRYFLGDLTRMKNTTHPHDKQMYRKLKNDKPEFISLVRDFVTSYISCFLFPCLSENYSTANEWKVVWIYVNNEIHCNIFYHNGRNVDSNHNVFFNIN